MSNQPSPGPTRANRVMYIDTSYTYDRVKTRGQEDFYHTRHSDGFFDHVWGVHPIADVGGSQIREVRTIEFSPIQTVIESASRVRGWPKALAPLDFLSSRSSLIRQLADTIEKEDVDLIIATDVFYSGLIGRALKKRTGRPLAAAIYANYDFAHQHFGFLAMPRLLPWKWLQDKVAERVLKSADLIMAGTRNYLEWGLKHGGSEDRSTVIPIARYIQRCHRAEPAEREDVAPLLQSLNIPTGRRYLLIVSRLEKAKFIHDGVKAMMIAAKKDPSVIGIVAGIGSVQKELEVMIAAEGLSDRVFLPGQQPQDALSRLTPHCITLSPLTGMALVEAGLGGSPVIAYDVDWHREFVEDGVNGFIVPPWKPEALAEKALELVQNEALLTRMSRDMRRIALERADRAKIAEHERTVFTKLIEEGRARRQGQPRKVQAAA